MAIALLGTQAPRVANSPAYAWTAADDAAYLASSYGLTPDPWQYDVIAAWLGESKNGRLVAGRCGLAVPRQNGKNGVLEIVELYKMVAQGRKILHTAHEVKTARKAFLRLKSFFENERKWPEMAALAKEIRLTNGQEAIVLHAVDCDVKGHRNTDCGCSGGGSVEFVARSRGSGRGFTVDDLVCDEAQELTDEQLEALLPTISASPQGDPQQIYTGTPPVPRGPGEVFSRLRREGVAGTAKRLSWIEWSIPDDVLPEDAIKHWRDNAAATNPALGKRLNLSTVEDELGAMSPEGFCRERLGQWPSGVARTRAIKAADWSATAVTEPPTDGVRSFGVAFNVDGTRAALAGSIKHAGGVYVEVVDAMSGDLEAGVESLASWLSERWRQVAMIAISGQSWSAALKQALLDRGVPDVVIHVLSGPEVFASSSMLLDALVESAKAVRDGGQPTLTHPLGQETDHLEKSVAVVDKKLRVKTSGAWAWEATTEDGDETPVEAISFAHWAARTSKRNPNRTQVLL